MPPIEINGEMAEEITVNGQVVEEVTANGQAVFQADAIPDSAVNRWPFDEGSGSTVADVIGTADGTINGATWVSGNWIGDFALDFDGVDDHVDVPTKGPSGSFSVAGTFNTDEFPSDINPIIGNYFTGNDEFFVAPRTVDGDTVLRFLVRTSDGVNNLDSAALSTGTNYRFVTVWDQNTGDLYVYINGSLSGSVSHSGTYDPSNTNDIRIGARADDETEAYNGRGDEPILFDGVLTAEEIEDDYQRQPWS